MFCRRLPLHLIALAIALPLLALAFLRLVFTPAAGTGTLLVLLSAREADHVAVSSLAIRSDSTWQQLGQISQREVPAAPATNEAMQVRVAAGSYDRLKVGEARQSRLRRQ